MLLLQQKFVLTEIKMKKDFFVRSEMLLGAKAMEKLENSTVAIFGIGGVGSYIAEALARSGIGKLILIDSDTVAESNINRQLIADTETIGMAKVDAAENRLKKINPDLEIIKVNEFMTANTDYSFLKECDYVADAIDTVSAKIRIAEFCYENKISLISAMAAGNKTDPTKFEVSDIYKTSVCPLCRVMRTELKKRNIPSLKVVYSKEEPIKAITDDGSRSPGSLPFVPSVMGLVIAREIVFDLIKE